MTGFISMTTAASEANSKILTLVYYFTENVCLINCFANIVQHKKIEVLPFYSTRCALSENI